MIIESCPHNFNKTGPGRPLTRLHDALEAKYGSRLASIHPAKLPQLGNQQRLGDGFGPCFDELALDALKGEPTTNGRLNPPNVFLGGGGASLHQLRHLRGGLFTRGTLWFSSHWAYADKLLREEYAKVGIRQEPIHPFLMHRAAKEQAESDFIIVPSEACKETYPKEVQEKAHVCEFGVDSETFKPLPEKPSSERLRILIPATNPARKGILYALRALTQLDASKIEVTITGGSLGDRGIDGILPGYKVHTPNWATDDQMRSWMQTHDVLLLPSGEEGQALSILEGAASGLPFIVTPQCGYEFGDGKQGFYVPFGDSKAIAERLQHFINDFEEVERMGKEARRFAEARPWSRFFESVINVIEEAK